MRQIVLEKERNSYPEDPIIVVHHHNQPHVTKGNECLHSVHCFQYNSCISLRNEWYTKCRTAD